MKSTLFTPLLGLALAVWLSPARAALPPLAPPPTQNKAPGDAAVVVGTVYAKLASDGTFANDAQAWRRLLRDTVGVPDERISVLGQPDPAHLLAAVQRQGELATETLWVVFEGHGAGDLLITWGANDDQESIASSHSVSRQALLDQAAASGAKRVVVVLDACRSGKDRSGQAIHGARFLINKKHREKVPAKVTLWSATRDQQFAHSLAEVKHGLFSYYAIRALSGEAGAGGEVHLERAQAWVADQLVAELRNRPEHQQSPELVKGHDPPVIRVPDCPGCGGAGGDGGTGGGGGAGGGAQPGDEAAPATRYRPSLRHVVTGAVEFEMGSPGNEDDRSTDERVHWVRLTRRFSMTETPITQDQWLALMESRPAHFAGCKDCPVERVGWYEALEFANRLSRRERLEPCYALSACTGTLGGGCQEGERGCVGDYQCKSVVPAPSCTGYRLPTEAEWEYAARAGNSDARHGPLDAVAWHSGNSGGKTHPVKGKRANAFGLHDMLGNVWQWCWDAYESDYPTVEISVDPSVASGSDRVVRGGSWSGGAARVRAADRGWNGPAVRDAVLGFRLVRPSP